MLRTVLAVALAVALLAVTTPALDDARSARTDRLTTRELDRVESAAMALVREEAPGARRTLTVSLPGRSPTAAQLAFVALGGVPEGTAAARAKQAAGLDAAESDVVAYRLAGGRTRVRRLGVDLRIIREGTVVADDSQALVLHGGETYRLTLRLVRIDGRVVVTVAAKAI